METKLRSIAKAGTWQGMGLVVMATVGYVITGSVAEGSTVAVSGAIIGTFTYLVHERIWDRVRWGRIDR